MFKPHCQTICDNSPYVRSLSACVCLVHVLSLLVLPTCVTICYIARGLIVLYVLMFGVVRKPT